MFGQLILQLTKKMNWQIFEEVTSYIKQNYKDISIRKLTDRFSFNEDYFNRLLKSKTGMTFTEYVQTIRLKEAEHLLLNTNFTIDEIVSMVGYQNKGCFYKIFYEKYKITLGKFRNVILSYKLE